MRRDVWHLLLWLDLAHAEHVPLWLQGLLTLLQRVGRPLDVKIAPDLLESLAVPAAQRQPECKA